jgi:hypothetical protein
LINPIIKTAEMRTLFTIIILLCTLTVFGQANSGKKEKWKVGVTFSPDTYLDSKSFSLTDETGFSSVSASNSNFTSGIVGEWSINSRFEIGLGINYSKKDLSGRYYCDTCEFLTTPSIEPLKVRFVEVPVFVRYNILNKQFGIHVEAGINNGYLLNTINSSYTGDLSANKYQISGLVGIGIHLALGQRINLSLTSDYRQSFTNLVVGSNLKYRSIGFVTGISYKIF